jgi:lipase maturation factor 1
VFLLDDRFIVDILPVRWRNCLSISSSSPSSETPSPGSIGWRSRVVRQWPVVTLALSSILLAWIAYATTAQLIWMFARLPLPTSPVSALEPFRIANRYGLFAVMTRGRYEIEFQGSMDGQNWIPYPFRFKPQELNQPPGIYAPYQPRFDWNLWFASLGSWREYPIVPNTEVRLLSNEQDVLQLFKSNPFSQEPPRQVRAVLWQYWFTTVAEKRRTGMWWRRQLLGLYAPTLAQTPDNRIIVVEWPNLPPRE